MLRACVLAGLLIACERSSTEQPKPTPRDAAIDAPIDALVDQARIDALDRLYTYFATTTGRKRSPVEANEQLTNAYREWIFAYGYARAGKPQRTAELVMTAKSRLETVADDPVHRVLADMYAARVTNALRIAELVQKAGASFAAADGLYLGPAMVELVRTIGKTHRTELGELWKRVEPKALDPAAGLQLRIAFAAGLAQLGDPSATSMLAALEAPLAEAMTLTARLEISRALVLGLAQLPRDEALAAIERLARQYPGITDSFGTNTHYAKSVLELMDIVVIGVVDE